MELIRLHEPLHACAILALGIAFSLACKRTWTWLSHFKKDARLPESTNSSPVFLKKAKPEFSEADYYHINPLIDFNLDNEEPTKLRTFKEKYHLTMAIEAITPNELLAMDKTYVNRIALRSQLIKDHQNDVLAWNLTATPAVSELYTWLTSTYLPRRFPTLYTLCEKESSLINNCTGTSLPLSPPSTEAALQILGENIDSDFLILLPIPDGEKDAGKYRLEGFITCFPSGFSTRKKLGLKLADIHSPVPGYVEKLERSMDRFFAGLPVGKVVKRANWSITTNDRLFAIEGNHMSAAELEEGDMEKENEIIDLRKTVLRCERQTLHRLPRTEALVFAFKTYQYPIKELREEGYGEELARAIDGLGEGNVPEITVYKRQVVWGEKVKKFLKGEIEIDD